VQPRDCQRGLNLGHRCAATHEIDGEPSCVFCTDTLSVPGPAEGAALCEASQRSGAGHAGRDCGRTGGIRRLTGKIERSVGNHAGNTGNGAAAIATRICARPGFTTPLGPRNRSGKCAARFRYEPGKSRSGGNAHVAASSAGENGTSTRPLIVAPRAAGGSEGTNGRPESVEAIADLAGGFREDRLNRLILGVTIADKAKIAAAWLKGEI